MGLIEEYFKTVRDLSEKPSIMIFNFIGVCLSVIFSCALNHSFWWCVLHFFLGWFYVLYVLLIRSHEILPALQIYFM